MIKGYNWFSELVYPFESQWSLLHKFAGWNALNLAQLNVAIGKTKYPNHNKNLSTSYFLDPKSFSEKTNLHIKYTEDSICNKYVPWNCEKLLISSDFRYCQSCISLGYHSVFHQLKILKKCPIHGNDLMEHCHYCGVKIPITISSKAIKYPYSCPSCQKPFFNLSMPGIVNPLTCNDLKKIESLSKIIINTLDYLENSTLIWKTRPNFEQIAGLLYLFFKSKDHNTYKFYVHNFRKPIYVEVYDVFKETENIFDNVDIYVYLNKILEEFLLKKHKPCLDYCIKVLGSLYVDENFNIQLGCIIAHSFLMWEVYWEKVQSISGLCRSPEDINWDKSKSISRIATRSIFAAECLDSFWFFLNEADKMNREKVFFLQTTYGEGSDPGLLNWVVIKNHHQESVTEELFFWRRKPYPNKEFKFSQKHLDNVFQSCNRIAMEKYEKRWHKE